jgi:hypothetical protein
MSCRRGDNVRLGESLAHRNHQVAVQLLLRRMSSGFRRARSVARRRMRGDKLTGPALEETHAPLAIQLHRRPFSHSGPM